MNCVTESANLPVRSCRFGFSILHLDGGPKLPGSRTKTREWLLTLREPSGLDKDFIGTGVAGEPISIGSAKFHVPFFLWRGLRG